jgi:hypothetical protein
VRSLNVKVGNELFGGFSLKEHLGLFCALFLFFRRNIVCVWALIEIASCL